MNAAVVKERPILFSGPMVRAILSGSKTVTRRIVKGRLEFVGGHDEDHNDPGLWDSEWSYADGDPVPLSELACPFGDPGERLWVREAFALSIKGDPASFFEGDDESDDTHDVIYRASSDERPWTQYRENSDREMEGKPIPPPWRPSIFMPRWASRLTLEVVSVGVERLQNITEAEAVTEGMPVRRYTDGRGVEDARFNFRQGWDTLHGNGSWNANPWVWRIKFKRVNPPETKP